ncbi:hypothetical protein MRS76_14745 [Rhizobiaceae bacterium n13]|uniref:hypothetical protein n=1 Tax=Ferirhizobium litorale TaxID=2927786 RepID=UPI0024B2E3F8|nr:hypothetical protein [Fererhizobium litorale]MDI7863213.1 hypothetical protein [Fererhizobium litorale]
MLRASIASASETPAGANSPLVSTMEEMPTGRTLRAMPSGGGPQSRAPLSEALDYGVYLGDPALLAGRYFDDFQGNFFGGIGCNAFGLRYCT